MKLFVVAMLSFVVSSCAANSFKQLKGIWTSCAVTKKDIILSFT